MCRALWDCARNYGSCYFNAISLTTLPVVPTSCGFIFAWWVPKSKDSDSPLELLLYELSGEFGYFLVLIHKGYDRSNAELQRMCNVSVLKVEGISSDGHILADT